MKLDNLEHDSTLRSVLQYGSLKFPFENPEMGRISIKVNNIDWH